MTTVFTDEFNDDFENGLTDISKSVKRQKQVALAINDELTEHDHLLSDLETGMDRTSGRLTNTTNRVTKVTKVTGLCGYYSVMVLLVVAIIVVAAL